MIKIALLLLAVSFVRLQDFDPEDAKYVCAAYSSDPTDKFAENEESHMIYYKTTCLHDVRNNNHFFVHRGRCENVYCSDEKYCICNNGNYYYNVCHMRSLGVFRGYKCDCADVEDSSIIRNPAAKSSQPIKDYINANPGFNGCEKSN